MSDFGSAFKTLQLESIDFSENLFRDHTLLEFPLQNNNADPAITHIFGNASGWVDLSEAYVELQLQLTGAGQIEITDDVAGNAIYTGLLTTPWGFYERANLRIGSNQIDLVENPGAIQHITNMMYKSAANAKSIAEWEGYYPLVSADGVSQANLQASEGYKRAEKYQALTLKRNTTTRGFTVQLRLGDVFGFCNVKKLLNSPDIHLQLTKSTDFNKMLFRGAHANPFTSSPATEVKLIWARLMLPQYTLHEDAETVGSTLLSNGNLVPFDYMQLEYEAVKITQDKTTPDIKTNAKDVRKIYVGFRLTADESDQTKSVYNYVNPGLKKLGLKIDGKPYPVNPYLANNFNQIPEGFYNYLRANDKVDNDMSDTPITYQEWENSQCIWVFDLSMRSSIFGAAGNTTHISIDFDGVYGGGTGYTADVVIEGDRHANVEMVGKQYRITG